MATLTAQDATALATSAGEPIHRRRALQVLIMNTLAFTVCFSAWMLNGVLVTFLVEQNVFRWTEGQIGWLIGIPVLSGSLVRLPIGMLTDKYGGRPVFFGLMVLSAIPMFLLSYANTYGQFLLASLGFGIVGGSFAVGIAYTSVWFGKQRQGTALGVFGMGNAGSAVTSIVAPMLLLWITMHGTHVESWRNVPRIYAGVLVVMACIFYLFTYPRKVQNLKVLHTRELLAPLRHVRVWRFGLYYFLVFGGFVALAQWLIPYYVNVYRMPVLMAGLMAAIFSFPSSVVRALGGWMSDHWGARRVMYWVLGSCVVCFLLLIVPRMEITMPGKGVIASRGGVVTAVTAAEITVGDHVYPLRSAPETAIDLNQGVLVWPKRLSWHEPVVRVGDEVKKKQLLAQGTSRIYFQANVWIFTALVFLAGFMMGIGKAAVYRHIPDYFPESVGVVGGMVGVIGGLGGFVCPIIFGYLLEATGVWTTSWIFLALISVGSLWWMHIVIQKMMRERVPQLMRQMDTGHAH
jgi:NNP family nitrate/nitrite transporter-like MFS transporter